MSSNNMLITLVGLSALIFAFQKYSSSNIVEHFGMLPKQMVSVERVVQQGPKVGDFYEVPGTYQAVLQPQQAGMVDYGANIRYNMPAKQYRADNMGTLEGYGGTSSGCRAGDSLPQSSQFMKSSNILPSNFASPSYSQQYNQLNFNQSTNTIPVNGISGGVNALGEATEQPIVYDRYIYANQKNPLYGLGDPIRGDLPIVPLEKGWFSPAAQPQSMLRDSALMVMGGIDNGTTKELMALKSAVSGGVLDTGSGINYSVQKSSFASGGGSNIHVTSFP